MYYGNVDSVVNVDCYDNVDCRVRYRVINVMPEKYRTLLIAIYIIWKFIEGNIDDKMLPGLSHPIRTSNNKKIVGLIMSIYLHNMENGVYVYWHTYQYIHKRYIYAHTHTHIYICVCVCVWIEKGGRERGKFQIKLTPVVTKVDLLFP